MHYTIFEKPVPAPPRLASVPGYPPRIATNPEKVELSLYYESLCPSSQGFIIGPLAKALDTDLMTIANLRLVPWGNAFVRNSTIICQHGEDECYLNIIHACAINIWSDVKTHFNFIKCSESYSSQLSVQGAEATWKQCAQQLGLPAQPIYDCYNSGQGTQLVLQFGKETEQLQPPHEYVPWVTVDKKPLRNDYGNFAKFVCDAYKGRPLPPSCSSHPSYLTKKAKLHLNGCGRSAKGGGMHQQKMEPSTQFIRELIVGHLANAVHSDLMTITNLRLVPWGNAVLKNSTIICQHGEDECYLNIIHACAIHTWPDVLVLQYGFETAQLKPRLEYVPWVTVDKKPLDDYDSFVKFVCDAYKGKPLPKSCSSRPSYLTEKAKHGEDECYLNIIHACAIHTWPDVLVLQYGNETAQLNPPHKYVPWVTVDKKPLEDDYEKFVKSVCDAYKGQRPPKICSSHPPSYFNEKPKLHLSGCGRSDNASYSSSHHPVVREPAPPILARELVIPADPQKFPSSPKKVVVSLYYESLCPYCRNFITGPLAAAFDNDLMTIANLRLVSWGNAILQNGRINCQRTHFNFIKCIEKTAYIAPHPFGLDAKWRDCAERLGLPAQPIEDCYDSGHGRQLVLQFGKETEQLKPPHEYVPWVTVNKKPLRNDYVNFAKHVCKEYRGQPLPKICNSYSSYLTEKAKSLQSVCYASKARSAKGAHMQHGNVPKQDMELPGS
ncbi:hypothetical protein Tsubulata_017893 [Turnera subulata]|uniref:Thioredoxin domain-containing protein n=1 Tax=Turnera subulata TaxID=218843 RepID=A0A9Q0IYZ1_9ROSI|nr:hypothetical protein Tsubulata_017893 [Turnera subulata]